MDRADKIFRFDDVSINSNMRMTHELTNYIVNRFPQALVYWGISPLVHNKEQVGERVYPKILNAYSDFRCFYEVDHAGLPDENTMGIRASHGLIHVDHRLLSKEAQEMSILISCSLIKTRIFIPPFNKWNKITEEICRDNGITLFKFEEGFLCMEHERYAEEHRLWYLHARDWTVGKLEEWLDA